MMDRHFLDRAITFLITVTESKNVYLVMRRLL